jgi:hypothetical protein
VDSAVVGGMAEDEVRVGAAAHLSYDEARIFYRHARGRAFERVRESLVGRGIVGTSFSVRGIDRIAVEAWACGWRGARHWSERGGFAWGVLQRRYCRKPRNFHVALWYGDALCGLAVGRVSPAHEALSLHFMEGSPDPAHPLRGNVAAIVFACAELYAVAVGAGCVLLKNPDPALLAYYAELGFGVALEQGNARYCRRDV